MLLNFSNCYIKFSILILSSSDFFPFLSADFPPQSCWLLVSSLFHQFSCKIWFQHLRDFFLDFLHTSLSFLPLWLLPATKQFPQLPKLSGRPPNSLCAPVGFPVDQSKRLPPISANQRAGGDGTGQSETGMPLTNSNCCYLAQIGLVLAVNGCFHIHTGICLIAAPSHYTPRGGAKAIHGKNQGKLFTRKIQDKNLEVFKYNQIPLKHKFYYIKKRPFTF